MRMQGVNVNRLKGKIVENGMNVKALSEKIGMNTSTFYRKLAHNGEDFTMKDANAIVAALGLSYKDAMSIFFPQTVALNATSTGTEGVT